MFPYDYTLIFAILCGMFVLGMICGSLCCGYKSSKYDWCVITSLLIGLIMAYTCYHVIGQMVTR